MSELFDNQLYLFNTASNVGEKYITDLWDNNEGIFSG